MLISSRSSRTQPAGALRSGAIGIRFRFDQRVSLISGTPRLWIERSTWACASTKKADPSRFPSNGPGPGRAGHDVPRSTLTSMICGLGRRQRKWKLDEISSNRETLVSHAQAERRRRRQGRGREPSHGRPRPRPCAPPRPTTSSSDGAVDLRTISRRSLRNRPMSPRPISAAPGRRGAAWEPCPDRNRTLPPQLFAKKRSSSFALIQKPKVIGSAPAIPLSVANGMAVTKAAAKMRGIDRVGHDPTGPSVDDAMLGLPGDRTRPQSAEMKTRPPGEEQAEHGDGDQ